MRRRAGLSIVLLAGAATLLIALFIGNDMGSRVVSEVAGRIPQFAPSATPVPEPTGTDATAAVAWKSTHVMAVATDPGFPDPRVTPPPPPPPPKPRATPSPTPSPTNAPQGERYTSPPLPIPLVSHAPDEASPEAAPSVTGGSVLPSP